MSGEPDLRVAEHFWAAYERAGYNRHRMARETGKPLRTIETWHDNLRQGKRFDGRHWVRADGDDTPEPFPEVPDAPSPTAESLRRIAEYFEGRAVPTAPPPTAAASPGDYATCLVGSDLHFPFHHEGAFEVFLGLADRIRPAEIVLDGDVFDFAQIGHFLRDPDAHSSFQSDIDACREQILARVSAASPASVRRFIVGNHEEGRWKRYLFSRCPEIAGLRCLTMEAVLGLTEMGWIWQPYEYWVTDSLCVYHGDRHTNALGGGSAMSARKESIDMGVSTVTGHCFSDDTEILTPDGWKRHDQIVPGDVVLTLDATQPRKTAPLSWNTVEAMYRYEHDGEMVRVKAHGLDLLVTEGHGLLWQAGHGKRGEGRGRGSGPGVGWTRMPASEMYGKENRYFPLAGHHDECGLPLNTSQVRVLAWVMAEGNISKDKNPCVRISQSDYDGHLEALEADLRGAGVEYVKHQRYTAGSVEHGQHRNYDAYIFNLRVKSSRWIFEYLDASKTPLAPLRRMSEDQMVAFLDAYVTADGSVNKQAIDARQIASNRSDHIDLLQELAVRTGHRSTVRKRPGGMYCLTINGRKVARTHKDSWSREPYKGIVWCPTVKNGTVVVRRNGCTAIACNTHHAGAFFRQDRSGYRVSYEIGMLGDWRKMQAANVTTRRTPTKSEDWHLACALIRYRPRHSAFRVELIPIIDDGTRTFAIYQEEEITA